ncbi:MAG: hypothetical protein ACREQA_15445 [Candidatus Binatia bacterium]
MSLQQGTVAGRILEAVRRAPGCELDDLELRLPDLTWNQVFLEVDHLSRTGQVRVMAKGQGVYTVRLPTKERPGRPKQPPRHLPLREEKKAA